MQEDQLHNFADNVDLSGMPSGVNYILIMPYPYDQPNIPRDTTPFVLTYPDEDVSIASLTQLYSQALNLDKFTRVQFTLSQGLQINDLTVKELSLRLGRSDLNGLLLYSQKRNVKHKIHLSALSVNQNAFLWFLQSVKEFGSNDLNIVVTIPYQYQQLNSLQVLVVRATLSSTVELVVNTIVSEINRKFENKIDKSEVAALKTKRKNQNLKWNLPLCNSNIEINKQSVQLVLELVNKQVRFVKSKEINTKKITIYREGEAVPLTFRFTILLKQFTFGQFYKEQLETQYDRQRKDLLFGLLVMDTVVKPNDKLQVLLKYFQLGTVGPQTIVGYVITEKMLFYYIINQVIPVNYQFRLLEQTKVKLEDQRDEWSKIMKIQQQVIMKRSGKKEPWIKFSLITVYTSMLKYFENGKETVFYRGLNSFLRDSPLLTLDLSVQQLNWKYRYSASLLATLQKVQKTEKRLVYRGVRFNPVPSQDTKILVFKQFISTSQSKQSALKFAFDSPDKTKYLLQMQILDGYKIQQFSVYTNEKQVLLEPFTEFSVKPRQQQPYKGYTLVTYRLTQIQTQKELPPIVAYFIIWVDDKAKQHNKADVYDQLKTARYNSILIQLDSTNQLKVWLERHQGIFKQPTARIIFLSNMVRTENNQPNYFAGVEAAKAIRKYDEKIKVFFFVGSINRAKQNCGDFRENVQFGTTSQEAKAFIYNQMRLE